MWRNKKNKNNNNNNKKVTEHMTYGSDRIPSEDQTRCKLSQTCQKMIWCFQHKSQQTVAKIGIQSPILPPPHSTIFKRRKTQPQKNKIKTHTHTHIHTERERERERCTHKQTKQETKNIRRTRTTKTKQNKTTKTYTRHHANL